MSIENENLIRALSDKPLLATSQWKCRCGWHTWTVWSSLTEMMPSVLEQFRECGNCKIVQRRVITRTSC